MQSISTPAIRRLPRLLVVELWGLGDLALAIPFLRAAERAARVTLLAQPHAEPLVRRFCPEVELLPLTAPWTTFLGKYRLHRWPWSDLAAVLQGLRSCRFDAAVSVRPDPRDHLLMALSGASLRAGFPRVGSRLLLTDAIAYPTRPHRAEHWRAVAEHFGWELSDTTPPPRTGRHIVIHTGAGQAVREWPRERFENIAEHLHAAGWRVTLIDNSLRDLEELLQLLDSADRFIGNDSGPGHLAALLGVPTFTIFGPQLPELFAPTHPQSAWIAGNPCPHKPCFDSCRFSTPNCLLTISTSPVWLRIKEWQDNSIVHP